MPQLIESKPGQITIFHPVKFELSVRKIIAYTSRISQKYPIVNKVLTLYGEGGPGIGPSQTLVLDITVQDKVLVKNLTPEGVQKVFNNEHVVDQQLERASNVIDEEETMKISPMSSYFIYDGFENI